MNEPIKLLIVDDHPLFRQGVRLFLETVAGLEVAGEAENGKAALARLAEAPVDVVLLDLQMPGLDGIETTREIAALSGGKGPHPHLLWQLGEGLFCPQGRGGGIRPQGRRARTTGGGHRRGSRRQLPGGPVAADLLEHVDRDGKPQPSRLPEPLSSREQEVLSLVARGMGNREIAETSSQRKDRQNPCGQHPAEAGCQEPHPGGLYAMRENLIGEVQDDV